MLRAEDEPAAVLAPRPLAAAARRAASSVRLINHGWPALPRLRQDRINYARSRVPGLVRSVTMRSYRPSPAVLVPVPKLDGGRRDAALLTVPDRLLYDVMVRAVMDTAPPERTSMRVFAPRGRHAHVSWTAFEAAVLGASQPFVVVADIERFGARVGHDEVAASLERAGCDRALTASLCSFLASIMASDTGIPNVVTASVLLAEAVLARVDGEVSRAGWVAFRCSDDIRLGTRSRAEGEAALGDIRDAVASVGLRLNAGKSAVLSAREYRSSITTTLAGRVWDAMQYPLDGWIVHGRIGVAARGAVAALRGAVAGRRLAAALADAPPVVRRRRRHDVTVALGALGAVRNPCALKDLPAAVVADPVLTPLAARYLARVALVAPAEVLRAADLLLSTDGLLESQRAWVLRALVPVADRLEGDVLETVRTTADGVGWIDRLEAIRLLVARREKPPCPDPEAVPPQFQDEMRRLLAPGSDFPADAWTCG